MAVIKTVYYRLNDAKTDWDEIYFKTTADLIQETTTKKVLTSDERTLIANYLNVNTFNNANKLVKLDSAAKVPTDNIPALDYIPTTGGDVSGDISFANGAGIAFPSNANSYTSTINFIDNLNRMTFDSPAFTFKLAGTTVLQMSSNRIDVSGKKIINVPDPVGSTDAANKQWVEQLVAQGTHVVGAVRAASAGLISSLSGAPKTIDGISLVEEDRVLVKDQTDDAENGVYIVKSGAWTRVDNDSDKGSLVFVLDGDTNKAQQYYNNGTEWGLFFAQVKYSTIPGGGLEIDSTGLRFGIKNGGVAPSMLAGNIPVNKLSAFEVIEEKPERDWDSIRTTIHGGGTLLMNKIFGLSSAITKLRGQSSLDDISSQTVKGAYELAESKTKIYLGSSLPSTSSYNAGDIYLLEIQP